VLGRPLKSPNHLWPARSGYNALAENRTEHSRPEVHQRSWARQFASPIRKRHAQGERQVDLAVEYGVCQGTISRIVNFKNLSDLIETFCQPVAHHERS